jgi:long-chain acyl-CoA synthetase
MSFSHELAAAVSVSVSPAYSTGLASVLHRQSTERPLHAAVVFDGIKYSYGDLHSRAQKFAAELRAIGIGKGDRAGLLLPNSADFIAAFFAIAGIGATIVPINPLLKSEEIAHILSDSAAKALIVHEHNWKEAQKAAVKLPELANVFIVGSQSSPQEIAANPARPRMHTLVSEHLAQQGRLHSHVKWESVAHPESELAVLVYTSGTTGRPKGAMLTHTSLMSTVEMFHNMVPITSNDKFLVLLPLCHIYGMAILVLGVLAKGGTLVMLDKFDPQAALELIEKERVSIVPAVPAMYQFMLMAADKVKADLSSLRLFISGAAPLPVALYEQLVSRFGVTVIEGYGLTETSSVVSVTPIGKTKLGSAGLPVPPVELAIIDGAGNRLPPGAEFVGEITVKGPNVMLGYFGMPEATSDCIKEGWLSTGDLGYVDEDGYLYIVGRSKELIIRGGQNIYPREIEDVILRMPQVAEAAVVGVPDQFMGERVKAFVVSRPGCTITEDEVKAFCAEHLAEYKVPRLVEFIAGLPRNSTGKVLKRTLVQT